MNEKYDRPINNPQHICVFSHQMTAHVKGSCVCAAKIIIPVTIGFAPSGTEVALDAELLEAMVQALCQEYSNDRQAPGNDYPDDTTQDHRVHETAQLI